MNDLSNMKAGDKVLLKDNYGTKTIKEIEKITPSGLIKVSGYYFLKDGIQRGSNVWNRMVIKLLTEQDEIEIERINFTYSILRQLRDLKSVSYEDALKFDKIINGKE